MIRETSGHIHTFEDGIMSVYVKPHSLTTEEIQESLDFLKEFKNENKELLLFIDPTDGVAPNTAQRKLSVNAFNEILDGLAIINTNLFVKFIITVSNKFDKPTYPVKIFKTKEDATIWLKSLRTSE